MKKLEKVLSSTRSKPRAVQRNVCLFQLKEGKRVCDQIAVHGSIIWLYVCKNRYTRSEV